MSAYESACVVTDQGLTVRCSVDALNAPFLKLMSAGLSYSQLSLTEDGGQLCLMESTSPYQRRCPEISPNCAAFRLGANGSSSSQRGS